MNENPLSQQEFLRDAMATLGLTRDEFAELIGIKRRRLDNWVLPESSDEFRSMDAMAWKLIKFFLTVPKGRWPKT